MTRQPHDQFAKQYLEELLAPLGEVETSRDVPSEVRQIDVWFVPAPSPAVESQNLGLLGQIAATASFQAKYFGNSGELAHQRGRKRQFN